MPRGRKTCGTKAEVEGCSGTHEGKFFSLSGCSTDFISYHALHF